MRGINIGMRVGLMAMAQAPITRIMRQPSGPGRKTLYTLHKAMWGKRYSGKDLREIRAHGQARECARRRRQMARAAEAR